MIDLDIQAVGLERARQTFTRIASKVKDLSPVWKLYAGFHGADLVEKTFNTNGMAMTGKQWPNYSDAYKKRKRKLGGRLGKKLVLSGELKEMATGGSGYNAKISKQKLTLTIEGLPYIRSQQFGYNGIPARPYFFKGRGDLPARAIAFLIKTTENHIMKGVK